MEKKSHIDIFIDWLKNNPELIHVLEDIRELTSYVNFDKNNSIWYRKNSESTLLQIKKEMSNFFSKYYSKELIKDVNSILDGTNDYFIDPKTKGSQIYFDGQKSHVSHRGNDKFLSFHVGIQSCLKDYLITAHELTHAMSSQYRVFVDRLRNNIDFNLIFNPVSDGLCEIESHIIERMYVKYLLDLGKIKDEDVTSYLDESMVSLRCEVRAIIDENGKLSKDIYGQKGDYGEKKDGAYFFRYIVGRVVADQWIKKYSAASKVNKKVMIRNYENYLKKTHEISFDDACQFLLGKDFIHVAQDFVKDLKNEQEKDKNPLDRTRGFWQGVKEQMGKAGKASIISCLPKIERSKTNDKIDKKVQ